MTNGSLGSDERAAEGLVGRLIRRWRCGATPRARSALDRHPELTQHPALVLDLAYEEFCLRRERGEPVRASSFCDQFPALRSSLQRMLAVHDLLDAQFDPERHEPPVIWPSGGESYLGFHLIEELGRGGLARVYLAVQPEVGCRPVALKISPHETGEAELLGRLSHDHIVPVYSRHADPGTGMTAVCMPYLGRKTLHDVLERIAAGKRRPQTASAILKHVHSDAMLDADSQFRLPVAAHHGEPLVPSMPYLDAVARIGWQLAEALAYSHEQGILHLDLKPSNILLTPRGIPLLLDFNLACDVHARRVLVGGTVPYMAPEALDALLAPPAARPAVPDNRSDLYSLGVILFQLATGRLPEHAADHDPTRDDPTRDNRPERGTQDQRTPDAERGAWRGTGGLSTSPVGAPRPRPPRTSPDPRLDPRFWCILRRCLEPRPQDRVSTARELAADLRKFVEQRRHVRLARPTMLRWVPYFLLIGVALSALLSRLASFLHHH